MKTRRTTLILEEGLYKQTKRLAVDQDKHFKDVVRDALQAYVVGGGGRLTAGSLPPFRTWKLGVREPLRRRDIYEERLDKKFPRLR